MYIQDNLEQLRIAANKLATQRTLKSLRVGLIIFGVLTVPALVSLAETTAPPFLRAVWVSVGVLGIVMVACGIWFCVQQRRVGVLIGGLLLIAIGLANGIVTIARIVAARTEGGQEPAGWEVIWIVFGIMQIFWGVQMAARYRRLAGADNAAIPQAMLDWLKQNLMFLASKASLADSNVLQIIAEGPQIWRVSLHIDGAVAVRMGSSMEILVALPQQVALETTREDKKIVPVSLKLNDRTLEGKMPREHIVRFRQWQIAVAAAEALPTLQVAPDAPPPLPTFQAAPPPVS